MCYTYFIDSMLCALCRVVILDIPQYFLQVVEGRHAEKV